MGDHVSSGSLMIFSAFLAKLKSSSLSSGVDIHTFEDHGCNGFPDFHCTQILTEEVFRELPLARYFILRSYFELRLFLHLKLDSQESQPPKTSFRLFPAKIFVFCFHPQSKPPLQVLFAGRA
jgi:hypothetical protein